MYRVTNGPRIISLVAMLMLLCGIVSVPTQKAYATTGWTDPVSLDNPAAGWLANNCNHPGYGAYVDGLYHTGRDFLGSLGDSVRAIGSGTVVLNADFGTGYGRALFIKHKASDGTEFLVLYGHINSGKGTGDTVAAGDVVGALAALSANDGGPHLHFGLVPGTSYPSSGWGRLSCASWPSTNGFADPIAFLGAHPGSGGSPSTPTPDSYYHGTPPNGAVIENHDGGLHKYVAIGGVLVWIPPETIWGYVDQMHRMIPSGQFHEIVWMHDADIHTIEYGYGGDRSHIPADNSFFYEAGSTQQYVMKFGYAFAVDGGESDYLGGVNRAVMVPPGVHQRLQGVPDIPNDTLFRSTDPTLFHQVNGTAFWVPDTRTADCIRTAKHGQFYPVPGSLLVTLQNAGRLRLQATACDFTHGQVLYGQPSGRQLVMLYGKGFAIGSPEEAAAIGAVDLAQPVADSTLDILFGQTAQVPQGHVFRAGLDAETYHYVNGTFSLIDSPLTRDCLLSRGELGTAEEVVPRSFIAAFPKGPNASCQLDNRQLLGPDGSAVGYVKDGVRHWVPNPAIRDCLIMRLSTGQPVSVSSLLWNSYTSGVNAYCPYEREPGLNFVQEQGSPIVWLVGPATGTTPGVKRHAGSLCVNDPYTTTIKAAHVFTVPAGETAGHVQGSDWWPTSADCQGLPQG